MEVNVDTLFNACMEGRANDLRALCSQGHAHFLNEMIENPDTHARFTVVYAYLEHVNGEPDYDVMEALYDCGADFNCQLIKPLEDGSVSYTHLFQLAIQVWKNEQLAKWLIAHGINLDFLFSIMKDGKPIVLQNLLRIELDPNVYSEDVLLMMVASGVDTTSFCDETDQFGAIPPLFVAVAMNRNVDQAATLIFGGAKTDFIVTEKNAPQRSFIRYCEICDRNGENYIGLLTEAMKMAERMHRNLIEMYPEQ